MCAPGRTDYSGSSGSDDGGSGSTGLSSGEESGMFDLGGSFVSTIYIASKYNNLVYINVGTEL